MRLDKLLSNLKYGSRSEIKKFVKDKRVSVNGEFIKDAGFDVSPLLDQILFDDEKVFYKEKFYLMLNKPAGYISANNDGLHQTVVSLIKEPYNRFDLIIVGRLDIDTEGLLLITNDGEFAHFIISPKHDVYKKYYVKLESKLENYGILEKGVDLLDGMNEVYHTQKSIIEPINDNECFISIKEGKFHQIKRMFQFIGNKVTYLKRISVGNIVLDENLKPGEYKEIEVNLD